MQPHRRLAGAAHRQDSGRVPRKPGSACVRPEKTRAAQATAAHQAQLSEYLIADNPEANNAPSAEEKLLSQEQGGGAPPLVNPPADALSPVLEIFAVSMAS